MSEAFSEKSVYLPIPDAWKIAPTSLSLHNAKKTKAEMNLDGVRNHEFIMLLELCVRFCTNVSENGKSHLGCVTHSTSRRMAHAAPSTDDVMIRFAANVVGALCVVTSVEYGVVVVVVDPESRRKNLMTSAAASLDTHAKFLSMSSIAADDSAAGTPSTFSIVLNFKGNQ